MNQPEGEGGELSLGLGEGVEWRTSPKRILASLPTLCPGELDTIIMETHSIGNVARLRFARQLLIMKRSSLFRKLGFPSLAAYSSTRFKYEKSLTYQFVRVARLIDDYPNLERQFCRGELSWRLLRAILGVASPATECQWIELLEKYGPETTIREARSAKLHNRDDPRDDPGGLPDEPVKLFLELLPEEHELVAKGLAKVADEMRAGLVDPKDIEERDEHGDIEEGECARLTRVEVKDALLYAMRRILETEPKESPFANREDRGGTAYTVLHTLCRSCSRAALQTAEGEVEIDVERVDAIGACAEHVVIAADEELPPAGDGEEPRDSDVQERVPASERDRPNSRALSKKVILKGGRRCANPVCDSERGALHAHHVVWRVNGGRTAIWNEAPLCSRCHSLVHLKYLAIEGDPINGLRFRPKGSPSTRELQSDLARLSTVVESRRAMEGTEAGAASAPTAGSGTGSETGSETGSRPVKPADPGLIAALRKVGFPVSEAREALERAYRVVEAERPEVLGTDEGDTEILRVALGGRG